MLQSEEAASSNDARSFTDAKTSVTDRQRSSPASALTACNNISLETTENNILDPISLMTTNPMPSMGCSILEAHVKQSMLTNDITSHQVGNLSHERKKQSETMGTHQKFVMVEV